MISEKDKERAKKLFIEEGLNQKTISINLGIPISKIEKVSQKEKWGKQKEDFIVNSKLNQTINDVTVIESLGKVNGRNRFLCLCNFCNEKFERSLAELNKNQYHSCFQSRKKIELNKDIIEEQLKTIKLSKLKEFYGYKSSKNDYFYRRLKEIGVSFPEVRNNEVNHGFFTNLNKDSAYFLGFITADGYIQDKYKQIIIEINKNDRYILEQLKKLTNHSGNVVDKVRRKKKNGENILTSRIIISSKEMVERLNEFGLYQAKSKKELNFNWNLLPDDLFYDFIRGFFDGDGCCFLKKENGIEKYLLSIFASNHLNFLKEIQEKINLKSKIQKKRLRNSYALNYQHRSSKILYERMYYDNCICLERKRNKFNKLLRTGGI